MEEFRGRLVSGPCAKCGAEVQLLAPLCVEWQEAKALLLALFKRMGVVTVGTFGDPLRWSAEDFLKEVVPALRDVTSTETGPERRYVREGKAPELVAAEVQPNRIVLKVGTLEVTAQGDPGDHAVPFCGYTKVVLDGKRFPVRSLRVEGDVDSVWKVAMEYFPAMPEG